MKKGTYLVVFLTVCIYVFLATGTEGPKCFRFTWVSGNSKDDCNEKDDDNNDNNDKNQQSTPCINPLCNNPKEPNLAQIWDNHKKDINDIEEICNKNLKQYSNSNSLVKPLERHSVCVRYTYMYNDAVVNISYFVGRVIEDQTTPVTSGCYVQYAEGYSIEACVCNNSNSENICFNSTIRNTYSSLIIFVAVATSLFMCKIFNIF